MRFGNLIFGVALLLVAATLALTITFRNAPADRSAGRGGAPVGPASSPRPTAQDRTLPPPASPRKNIPRPPRRQESGVQEMDIVLDDGPTAPRLSPAERQTISQRTSSVKKAAFAKLDKMTERFDLTPEQRLKIFPLLVQSTEGYHPVMIVTTPVGPAPVPGEASNSEQTPDLAIHDALDPEQQEQFVEAALDERAWWSEIVAQLVEDFDSAAAAGTAPPVQEDAPEKELPDPAVPEPIPNDRPQQGDNIFDLIK
ncbi:MAG: hypothetical protein GWO24_28175 [Akkermansiaceae bacterium]|nr:hypothetical protein [Akkermansiaceae bacterium]